MGFLRVSYNAFVLLDTEYTRTKKKNLVHINKELSKNNTKLVTVYIPVLHTP